MIIMIEIMIMIMIMIIKRKRGSQVAETGQACSAVPCTEDGFMMNGPFGSFRKQGVPYFEVLIIGILLFRVLY